MGRNTSYSSKGKKNLDIAVLNIYAPNARTSQFIEETLSQLKSHIDLHTVIVGDFSAPLLSTDSLSTQTLNREVLELNIIKWA